MLPPPPETPNTTRYMHLNGIYVGADATKARSYFAQAAARGLAAGHTGLGVMSYEGVGGVPRNYTAARLHFEAGANGSNADAMFNLGNIYAHGGWWKGTRFAWQQQRHL